MELGEITSEKEHEQVYYTACRIRAGEVGGSGICFYSDRDASGKAHTLILTNHHVISKLIKVEKKWDPMLKREYPQEETKKAEVDFFQYNDYSRAVGSNSYEADILAWDDMEKRDIAVLKLREEEKLMKYTASLYPRDICNKIYMYDKVYAVGAALGIPVFQTPGEVTNASYEINGQKFIGTNSPITFGNSGGGLFKRANDGNWYLIGLPARVSMQGWGDVANHIGFAIPIEVIYKFLEDNEFQYVWDESQTIEECQAKREEKQKRAKERLLGK